MSDPIVFDSKSSTYTVDEVKKKLSAKLMSRKYFRIAISLLGSAVVGLAFVQTKVLASNLETNGGIQQTTSFAQKQSPKILAQAFNQDAYVEQFRQFSNGVVNRYRNNIREIRQNQYRTPSDTNLSAPYPDQGFDNITNIFKKDTDRIVEQYRSQPKKGLNPTSIQRNMHLYQRQGNVVDSNWVRP